MSQSKTLDVAFVGSFAIPQKYLEAAIKKDMPRLNITKKSSSLKYIIVPDDQTNNRQQTAMGNKQVKRQMELKKIPVVTISEFIKKEASKSSDLSNLMKIMPADGKSTRRKSISKQAPPPQNDDNSDSSSSSSSESETESQSDSSSSETSASDSEQDSQPTVPAKKSGQKSSLGVQEPSSSDDDDDDYQPQKPPQFHRKSKKPVPIIQNPFQNGNIASTRSPMLIKPRINYTPQTQRQFDSSFYPPNDPEDQDYSDHESKSNSLISSNLVAGLNAMNEQSTTILTENRREAIKDSFGSLDANLFGKLIFQISESKPIDASLNISSLSTSSKKIFAPSGWFSNLEEVLKNQPYLYEAEGSPISYLATNMAMVFSNQNRMSTSIKFKQFAVDRYPDILQTAIYSENDRDKAIKLSIEDLQRSWMNFQYRDESMFTIAIVIWEPQLTGSMLVATVGDMCVFAMTSDNIQNTINAQQGQIKNAKIPSTDTTWTETDERLAKWISDRMPPDSKGEYITPDDSGKVNVLKNNFGDEYVFASRVLGREAWYKLVCPPLPYGVAVKRGTNTVTEDGVQISFFQGIGLNEFEIQFSLIIGNYTVDFANQLTKQTLAEQWWASYSPLDKDFNGLAQKFALTVNSVLFSKIDNMAKTKKKKFRAPKGIYAPYVAIFKFQKPTIA